MRDRVRSRGLGDVYKRQVMDVTLFTVLDKWLLPALFPVFLTIRDYAPVSYTHLTPPTIYAV